MSISISPPLGTTIISPSTAFGEVLTAENNPVVQLQYPYSINSLLAKDFSNGGSISASDGMLVCSTGAAANQSGQLISRKLVKYNPGQGGLFRGTALFTAGVAGSTQWMGMGDSGDGYFFGFNGTEFSVLRREKGVPETRTLTITTASNTAEDITITLDGDTATDVTVSAAGADSASTRTITANEIADHDFSGVGRGWHVHVIGPNVIFQNFASGAKTGTYSLSSAATAVGTYAQTLAGVTATDNIIAQSAWSEGLPFTLDPTKGNVYQIQYQWLGFGAIDFLIENPSTKLPALAHRIEYANANTSPSVQNPTLPLCVVATNTSNTTDIVIKSGSMAGFIEGVASISIPPIGISVEVASVGTTETPVISIHNHTVYQGVLNRVESEILSVVVSVDGTKPSTLRLRKNATLTAAAFAGVNSNITPMRKDTAATAVTGGEVTAYGLGKSEKIVLSKELLLLNLEVSETLTISLEASAGTVDAVVTINWRDLF